MVKLSIGSEIIHRIAYKLQGMLKDGIEEADEEATEPSIDNMVAFNIDSQLTQAFVDHVDPAVDPDFWDIHCRYMLLVYM